METVTFGEAEDLVDEVCTFDFVGRYEDEDDNEGVKFLVRLIAGIAAIEDHEYRQLCAERAIRRAFSSHANAAQRGLSKFIAQVNQEFNGEGSMQ
jgi:hypothetical protein